MQTVTSGAFVNFSMLSLTITDKSFARSFSGSSKSHYNKEAKKLFLFMTLLVLNFGASRDYQIRVLRV